MMKPEERLAAMGIELPAVAAPVANYVPAKLAGDTLYVSGQLPFAGGALAHKGAVGKDVTLEDAKTEARRCAVNILAAAKAAVGELSRLSALRVEGFVASADGFTQQPAVINGASDLLVEALGEAGRHARFAVGVSRLPMDAAVEVAAIFKVS